MKENLEHSLEEFSVIKSSMWIYLGQLTQVRSPYCKTNILTQKQQNLRIYGALDFNGEWRSSPVALNRRTAHTLIEYEVRSVGTEDATWIPVQLKNFKFETCFRSSYPDATRKTQCWRKFRNTAGGKVLTSAVYNSTFHRNGKLNESRCARCKENSFEFVFCITHTFSQIFRCICWLQLMHNRHLTGSRWQGRESERMDRVHPKHLDASIETRTMAMSAEKKTNVEQKTAKTGKCVVK